MDLSDLGLGPWAGRAHLVGRVDGATFRGLGVYVIYVRLTSSFRWQFSLVVALPPLFGALQRPFRLFDVVLAFPRDCRVR